MFRGTRSVWAWPYLARQNKALTFRPYRHRWRTAGCHGAFVRGWSAASLRLEGSASEDPELADAFGAMEGGTVANAVHTELFVKQQRPERLSDEAPRQHGTRILNGPKGHAGFEYKSMQGSRCTKGVGGSGQPRIHPYGYTRRDLLYLRHRAAFVGRNLRFVMSTC